MTVRVSKKSRKMRGSRTMGWGLRGQHRDRGVEGGRQIGMSKDKWSWVVKYGKGWYGKHGFVNPTTIQIKAISLRQLDEMVRNGHIKVEENEGKKFVDLSKFGYDKLLGGGKLSFPIVIKVEKSSKSAVEKVNEVGGQVILGTTS
ncbi:uL15 family ribosomal protein [Sulfuracidifex metallicus]|jgi:large subunit ribosomal protein L15|uniref:Large ribosomal subunit protein uL15 n=2 Tax=Sulfuracidifex metallicus TaxID=47303 RepID=A0A6A9QLG4_SULME|nr:uL15 family ribosomal protein [Sulfuracidifex metallicus]MUN28538.1 50S ribosomal protein L15 [Sulfuracidifex metallicus DSM 6482 = JCM 9184]WOE50924.1 uL15 family ribosomal protein [Sulfuracidifex metallicus DSM 6482 = JCM 9184]